MLSQEYYLGEWTSDTQNTTAPSPLRVPPNTAHMKVSFADRDGAAVYVYGSPRYDELVYGLCYDGSISCFVSVQTSSPGGSS